MIVIPPRRSAPSVSSKLGLFLYLGRPTDHAADGTVAAFDLGGAWLTRLQ